MRTAHTRLRFIWNFLLRPMESFIVLKGRAALKVTAFKTALAVAILAVVVAPAHAVLLTETFPDPLGGFYTRWLGVNSNTGSFYLSSGSSSDPDFRGNNPEGLWISANQTFGGGVSGVLLTIDFNPSFASTLTSLSFGIEAFRQLQVRIYDSSNNLLASSVFSGGDFGFGHEDSITAISANGIRRIQFDSSTFGGGQVSGNTSVDNFVANTLASVSEPSSLIVFGSGLLGLGAVRKIFRKSL